MVSARTAGDPDEDDDSAARQRESVEYVGGLQPKRRRIMPDRGVVHFDLGKFDQLYLARLTFNISRNEQGGGTGRGEPCANIILGMSTSQMNWDFDNAVALPSDCPSPVSLNVTSKVQQWIDTSHANFGFIFAGPRLSLPDDNSNLPTDNDFNHTFYNQFQLFILFNRLLNRRVPP